MLSILSLVAAADAETLPLPESNPAKYEEVGRFLDETAEKAKDLIARADPLIDRLEWQYESLGQLSVSALLVEGSSRFTGHLHDGNWGYYPLPLELDFNTVEHRSSDFGPYGMVGYSDRLVSTQQGGSDWAYCYGGIKRFSNPGKTYDIETIEVEDIKARLKGKNTYGEEDHVHPDESECITVTVSKWSTKPIRPLGEKADAIRQQYGEFAPLGKNRDKFFDFELVSEEILRSTDACETVKEYEGFSFQKNAEKSVWLKPELEMKEDWEARARDLCDFIAGYQTPKEK